MFWPEPGDEVVVGFINGDPRQAIILGALHGSANAPPDAAGAPSKDNHKRALVSKGGMVIGFDDEKKSVRIETPGKNKIVIDDDAQSSTLADQHGNTITLVAFAGSLKAWFALMLPVTPRWRAQHEADRARVLRIVFRTFVQRFMLVPAQIIRTGWRLNRLLAWRPDLSVFFRLLDAL